MIARLRHPTLFLFPLLLGLGCDRPPAADRLKEWTPNDHHSAEDEKAAQARQGPKGGGGDERQAIEAIWQKKCFECHGAFGKGDGPKGAKLRAHDLTADAWQAKVSDADIVAVIRNGKNDMPKFDLPEPVLRGLVARIRATRGM